MNSPRDKPSRVARLQTLFARAIELPAGQRNQWLREIIIDDAPLLDDLQILLEYDEMPFDPLEAGIVSADIPGAGVVNYDAFDEGDQIGKFHVQELLGVGSFGAVYRCWDPALARDVAIKVLHTVEHGRDEGFVRQLAEAQAVAALDCPGVVPVYVGDVTPEGRPYFVMKYIEGTTLEVGQRDVPPSPVEAAALIADVADTIAKVHAKGLLHRDLKPSNIIIDKFGQPFVADFGLASRDCEPREYPTGLAGTPAYMAPEQYQPDAMIDARADVWALGVILFELLSGRRPFQGESFAELRAAISNATLAGPSDVPDNVSAGLWRICRRCLQKRADDRFSSASELANALWRQCPPRLRPVTKRHTTTVAAAIFTVSSLVVIGSLLSAIWSQSRPSHVEQGTDNRGNQLRQMRYVNDMAAAYRSWERRGLDDVYDILNRHRQQSKEDDNRGFEWHFLNSLSRQPEPIVLVGHGGAVNELAVFSDHRRLASIGEDGTLCIWDIPARQLIAKVDLGRELEGIDLSTGGLHSVAVSPDGRYVVAGADVVGICDLKNNLEVRELLRDEYNVDSLAFSADGHYVAAGTRYEHVSLLSLDGEVVAQVPSGARAEALQYLPDPGQWLIPNVGKRERSFLQLWDARFEHVVREFDTTAELGASYIKFARVSPCGRYVVAAHSITPELQILEFDSGALLAMLAGGRDKIADLDFSPTGEAIVAAHTDGHLRLLRVQAEENQRIPSFTEAHTVLAHPKGCSSARFLDTDTVLTSGSDGIKVWDRRSLTNKVEIRLQGDVILSPSYLADGQHLALLSRAPPRVSLINGDTGQVVRGYAHPGAEQYAISPTGDKIAVICRGKTSVTVLDEVGDELFSVAHPDKASSVCFSPDGRTLASVGHVLQIADASNGEVFRRRSLPKGARWATFSHRGTWLAYGGQFDFVGLEPVTQEALAREFKCRSVVTCIDVSADDAYLASSHEDGVIRVWNVAAGQLEAKLVGHERRVVSVSFSPDGRTLLSADDKTVRIWSVRDGRLLGIVCERPGITSATISPDGRRVVASIAESDRRKPNLVIWQVDFE